MFAKVTCKASSGLERKQARKRKQSPNDEDERAPDTLIQVETAGLRLRSRGRIAVDSGDGHAITGLSQTHGKAGN